MKKAYELEQLGIMMMICFASLICISCSDFTEGKKFGIFKVIDDKTVEMNGDIKRSTLRNFNRLLDAYPNIKMIHMNQVPGSRDDDTNLQVAKKVHDLGISTHLVDDGEIASGGVDFFLAGVKRTQGENTNIGVHSWEGDGQTATDFPKGHEYHLQYIDYYISVGFSQQEAEDFYYFTINSAAASDIHWMTEEEITKYKILKE